MTGNRMDDGRDDERIAPTIPAVERHWSMDPQAWSDVDGHAFMCNARLFDGLCDCGGGEWIARRKLRVKMTASAHKNLPYLDAVAPDGIVVTRTWVDGRTWPCGEVVA